MIYVSTDSSKNEVINLTVGDDAVFRVPMTTPCGDDYEMGDEEYLIFSVREKPTDESPLLIEVESEKGSNRIPIKHEDTADLDAGFYSADIQLMTEDGQRVTVWPKLTGSQRTSTSNRKNFCLMTEVTRK